MSIYTHTYTRFAVLALAAVLFGSSCAGGLPPIQTATGKPEVTLPNVTKKQAVDYLTVIMLNREYQVRQVNDYMAAFGKAGDTFAARFLFGTKFNRVPDLRVTYNFVDTPAGLRVIATLEIITNPNSGFQRVRDFSAGGSAKEYYQILLNMKGHLAGPKPTGAGT